MALSRWFGAQSPTSPEAVATEHVPVISTADAKLFGFENFGNTCYANSVLQALYFCGPFRDLVIQHPDSSVSDVPLSPSPPFLSSPLPPSSMPSTPIIRRRYERKFSMSESHTPALAQAPSTSSPNPSSIALSIPTSPPTLLSALRSLFIYISKNPVDKGTVAPRAFIDKLKEVNEHFRSTMHQDAHEFLNFLLNKIVEEIEEEQRNVQNGSISAPGTTPPGDDLSASVATISSITVPTLAGSSTSTPQPYAIHSTLVHRLFEGTLTSETRCLTCETISSRDESFLDLSIDIEQNSSVTACLKQFSASEMLCQKNKFFCDACCDLQEAEKRMKIKKLPNVLALHLKRFKYEESVGRYIKLTYRVAFPFELRLFNTVDDAHDPDRLYELFAIVVHIGNGPHHGHYVTIIKARGNWLLFDDENVDTIKESDIPKYFGDSGSGSAYVLYYQAVDIDLVALGVKPVSHVPAPDTTSVSSGPGKTPSLDLALDTGDHPALPPGLTDELDSSDQSESPPPATPSLVPLPLTSPLKLSIPSEPLPPSSPVSTPTRLSGLLRNAPSLRFRTNGNADKGAASSDPDAPPVPPIPSYSSSSIRRPRTAQSHVSVGLNHTAHDIPPIPALPAVTPPSPTKTQQQPMRPDTADKEKYVEKDIDRKHGWFSKRRSFREKPPGTAPASTSRQEGARFSPVHSPKLSNGNGHVALGRRASAMGLVDTPRSPTPVAPLASMPEGHVDSTNVAPIPIAQPKALPHGHNRDADLQRMLLSKREHRVSSPSPPITKLPPRPSTAGATVGRSPRLRPMSSAMPANLTALASSSPLTRDSFDLADPSQPDNKSRPSSGVHSPRGLGMTMSEGSTLGGAGSIPGRVGNEKKKTTRKLSFVGPIFGFGRKDKDKDKDRHKDKDKGTSLLSSTGMHSSYR